MNFKKLYILAFLFVSAGLYAQTTYNSSQWSRYLVSQNVAYAGYYDYLTAGIIHRSQWVGWNNAPSWQDLEIQSPLKSDGNAISFTYGHEDFPTKFQSHKLNLGYTHIIKMSSFKTAFGLGLGINYHTNNLLETRDPEDPAFMDEKQSYLIPQATLGIAFYNEKFHAGLSIPEFFGVKTNESGEFSPDMNFSDILFRITGGYKYSVSTGTFNVDLSSNALVKYQMTGVMQIDVNTIGVINDAIIAGLGFRVVESAYLVLGYQLNKQFSVAYSYDFVVGALRSTKALEGIQGSHMIGLVYNLNYLVNTANPRPF